MPPGTIPADPQRKTPLDDLCSAVHCTLFPFAHPILLEESDPADLRADAEQVASLVAQAQALVAQLRALARPA